MIQTTHFRWLPSSSAWQEAQAWRARRQALVQDTLDAGDTFNSAFANAATNKISGAAKLAALAAVARIKAATKAQLDKTAAIKIAPVITGTAAITIDPAVPDTVDKTV
jgi:hypothetical protein